MVALEYTLKAIALPRGDHDIRNRCTYGISSAPQGNIFS